DEEDSVKNVLMVGRNISERKKMEQALRESEEKYKNLFQCLQEAVFILYEGKIIQCNPAATRIFGCKQNQLVGKTVCDISPPRQPNDRLSRDLANKLLRKVMDGKEQFFEWEHLRCDGTVFLTEVNLARYILQDKKFVFGIVRDISEKHLAEQQLKISEARYRDIVERSLDGYYFLNCEGIATIVNSSVLEITGLQREQVMNANFADFVPEDKKEYVLKLLTSVMGGTPYSWEEIELIRSDGKKIWIAFNGRRVIQNGIVIGVEGFVRDITELKKTENKIRESEARYKALFDSIPYEVFGLDAEGVFHEANQEFIQNWGNVVERLPNSIKNKELRTIITESLENVSKTLKSAKRNFEIKKNDLTKHFTLILCPIITKEEGLIGFVGINMDISELIFALREAKLMSARLLDIQEEERTRIASEIHDSLGQYMTALQLEISTANASLRSNPDLAEKVMSDAKQTITRAIIEAKDLCHVLRPHLLDDFGLVVAIKDYAKEYSQKWKIKIDFHADDVKGLLSQTSETALYRFVQEALTNILKHSRATHAEIRLTRTDNVIELKICDDGVGFNKDIVYYSKRDRFGLIFMKERIEFLGGRFILDSTLEKGTTLKAILPIDE
ncbi:PAS domain S-box protein, partial [candidate division KSB1 bacterium]|nr:PAS domain S-box protein [candidate division KSB1 bacterium]